MAISNALADKFSNILNAHRGDVFDDLLQMNNSKVSGVSFTVECILEAFNHLKSDGTELDSSHYNNYSSYS